MLGFGVFEIQDNRLLVKFYGDSEFLEWEIEISDSDNIIEKIMQKVRGLVIVKDLKKNIQGVFGVYE